MYRSLNSEKVIDTIETLGRRIDERFPDSGLRRVCEVLLSSARQSHERSAWIAKPQMVLRAITGTLVVLIFAGLISVLAKATWPNSSFDLILLVQVSEAASMSLSFSARPFYS